jgi:hypothetical protein
MLHGENKKKNPLKKKAMKKNQINLGQTNKPAI